MSGLYGPVSWLIFFQFEPHDLVLRSKKPYSEIENFFSGCPYGDTTTRVSDPWLVAGNVVPIPLEYRKPGTDSFHTTLSIIGKSEPCYYLSWCPACFGLKIVTTLLLLPSPPRPLLPLPLPVEPFPPRPPRPPRPPGSTMDADALTAREMSPSGSRAWVKARDAGVFFRPARAAPSCHERAISRKGAESRPCGVRAPYLSAPACL